MTASQALAISASIVGFLLKTSACFAAVKLILQLLRSPGRRYMVWLAYLIGCFCYALTLAASLLRAAQATTTASLHLPVGAAASPSWILPEAWSSHLATLLAAAAVVYSGVLLSAFALYLRRRTLLRRALLFGYSPGPEVLDLAAALERTVGVGETSIRLLPGLASPATIGWLRPLVLLPTSYEQQSLDQAADILHHELQHIRRRDWILDRLARSIRMALCFQPAITLALRALCLERELACDQAVIGPHPEARARYAESLILVARSARAFALEADAHIRFAPGIDFAAAAGHLQTRIRAILAVQRSYPRGLRALVALCTTTVIVLLALGLQSLTVTFAFAREEPGTPAAGLAVREIDAGASRSSRSPASTASRATAIGRAKTVSPSLRQSIAPLPQLPAQPALDRAPEVGYIQMRSAAGGSRIKLEPAADAEDDPSQTLTGRATQPGHGGPLTTHTNPGIQAGSPTHGVVSVLTDAAVILSRRDSDHDH